MRSAVRFLDVLLSKQACLFEFSQEPDIILRLQLRTAPHRVEFSGVTITKGDPVLGIHVWNERMPRIPPAGADLEWALTLNRRLIHSFNAVAQWIQADSRADSARAICGFSALFSFTDHTGGLRMIQHLGFAVLPYHRPLGRFGDFWENLLSWGIMWAYNDASLRSRKFWRLQRSEIWMAREDFLRRFS